MPTISARSLEGVHRGLHGALVCPGTSLEEWDLEAQLAGYDIRIAVNEALYVTRPDYLTCFDVKAARKTLNAWPPRVPVVCHEEHAKEIRGYNLPNTIITVPSAEFLTRANAGSLGLALGFARHVGLASLHLYGVDLCRPADRNYAKDVMARRDQRATIHEASMMRVGEGRHAPDHFLRFAREIEAHKAEWDGMSVTNMNPWSLLGAFPKRDPLTG